MFPNSDQNGPSPLQTAGRMAAGMLAPITSIADPYRQADWKSLLNDVSFLTPGVGEGRMVHDLVTRYDSMSTMEKWMYGVGAALGTAALASVGSRWIGKRFGNHALASETINYRAIPEGVQVGEPLDFGVIVNEQSPRQMVDTMYDTSKRGILTPEQFDVAAYSASEQALREADPLYGSVRDAQNFEDLADVIYERNPELLRMGSWGLPARLKALGKLILAKAEAIPEERRVGYFGADRATQELNAAKQAVYRFFNLVEREAFGEQGTKDILLAFKAGLTGASRSAETGEILASTSPVVRTTAEGAQIIGPPPTLRNMDPVEMLAEIEHQLTQQRIGPDNIPDPGQMIVGVWDRSNLSVDLYVGASPAAMPDMKLADVATGKFLDDKAIAKLERQIDPETLIPDFVVNTVLHLGLALGRFHPEQIERMANWYRRFNQLARTAVDELGIGSQVDQSMVVAMFSLLSAKTQWAPDNVVAGLHMLMQTFGDLEPGSPEYTAKMIDIIEKGGWGPEIFGEANPAVASGKIFTQPKYVPPYGGQPGSFADLGPMSVLGSGVEKAAKILDPDSPYNKEAMNVFQLIRSLKMGTFYHIGVNPDDKLLSVIDSLQARISRGFQSGDLVVHAHDAKKLSADTVVDMPDGPVTYREGQTAPTERGAAWTRAHQAAIRIVAQMVEAGELGSLGEELKLIVDSDVVPNTIQAVTWSEISDAIKRQMRTGGNRFLSDSYVRTLEGINPLHPQPLDWLSSANPDIAAPPAIFHTLDGIKDGLKRKNIAMIRDRDGRVFANIDEVNVDDFSSVRPTAVSFGNDDTGKWVQLVPVEVAEVPSAQTLADKAHSSRSAMTVVQPARPGMVSEFDSGQSLTAFVGSEQEARLLASELDDIPGVKIETVPIETKAQTASTDGSIRFEDLPPARRPEAIENGNWVVISPMVTKDHGVQAYMRAHFTRKQLAAWGFPNKRTTGLLEEAFAGESEWSRHFLESYRGAEERLRKELSRFGTVYEAAGVYQGEGEKSFLVFGADYEQAIRIGRRYGQESIAVPDGLVYTSGNDAGMLRQASGKILYGDAAARQDFHTAVQLGNGETFRFSVDVPFDKKPLFKVDPANLASRTVDQGGVGAKLVVSLGLKPSWETVDEVWRRLGRNPTVKQRHALVNGRLYRPSATLPAYARVSADPAGVMVSEISRIPTGGSNEFTMFVDRTTWHMLPEGKPRVPVEETGGGLLVDGRIPVRFEPDAVWRPGDELKSSTLVTVKTGRTPEVTFSMGRLDKGLLPEPGTVVFRALRGSLSEAKFNTIRDLDEAMFVIDKLELPTKGLGRGISKQLKELYDSGSGATPGLRRLDQSLADSVKESRKDWKKLALGDGFDSLIPKSRTKYDKELSKTLSDVFGKKVEIRLDGLGTEQQRRDIGDMLVALVKGDASNPYVGEWLKAHPGGWGDSIADALDQVAISLFPDDKLRAGGGTSNVWTGDGLGRLHLNATHLEMEARGIHREIADTIFRGLLAGGKGTPDYATTLIHEMGHVVTRKIVKMGLSSPLLTRIKRAYIALGQGNRLVAATKLSYYSVQTYSEFFAEAFAEALTNPKANPIVRDLVEDAWKVATGKLSQEEFKAANLPKDLPRGGWEELRHKGGI